MSGNFPLKPVKYIGSPVANKQRQTYSESSV